MEGGATVLPAEGPDIIDVQLALGQQCLDRGGAEQARAVEWFRIAARSGDARAVNMLGRCHEHGWGVPADPVQAAVYYRRAAELGDAWAPFNLADLHCRGVGVPADDGEAYRLYADAARRGNVKALNMLGLFHEAGRAVAEDGAGARRLFQAAAEGGDCWGRFNHARLLLQDGRTEEALGWFARALETGFPDFHRGMAAALADQPDPRLRALAQRAGMLAGDKS
ncbi:tetratricopeptide repeat protein [Azospirillum isscasi]|uniref:Tetratricopeptide repeat protein n=1 Tax=Azospirillum isscasi TaxID=3053926 RepID=A0ABU0WM37_9PROT|nr:tetratricopeptide repeat protein [Azospirillum isscasi]MDQ2105300.1 tetratricopeptide repeat protein [Azospirillum isscasi]